MKQFRPAMHFFFTAILTVLAMLAAILLLPASSYAFGSNPPLPNTSAPGQGTCASCHGTLMAGSGVTVNAPSSYTPGGKAVTMTVTIPATGGFELEVVTQISNVQAGVLAAGTNDAVSTVGAIQFAYSTGETTSWTFSWTPPATNVGSVVLYVTGGGHSPNYSNNFVMTPAAATTITVPSVVGATQASATTTLTTAGLKLGTVTTASSTTVMAGLVISQNPASGAQVTSGSAVTLVVSTGSQQVTVPSVVGATQAAATTTLTSAGLTLGTVTTASSTTVAAGSVISQNPISGAKVASGSVVNLVTSSGATGSQDFSLSASPSSLAVTQGASGSSMITVTPSNGFNSAVTFTVAGVPSGVTASFASSTLTLAASSTATTGPATVTITGTSGSLTHMVTLGLTVNATAGTGTGALTASPSSLTFNYQMGGKSPASRTLAINSSGGSISYTAKETDPWLTINPTSGASSPGTPGSIQASVNPAGMAAGSYGAQINVTAQNGKTTTVSVALIITSGSGGGGGGTRSGMNAQAYVSDTQSGTLAAAWVDNLGTSPHNTNDPLNRGLVLAKGASASVTALAGATIQNVTGISLTELGFDFRAGITCSTDSPHFVVVTTDGVTHTVGGCSSSAAAGQTTAPMGWMRLRFNPSQATPPIQAADQVQSISVVLDKGANQPGSSPTQNATGSIVVIDNITINGTIVGKGPSTTPTPTPQPPPSEGHRDD